ncbi:MAG TPA: nucleotidyltransferase family protein [Vicinamibacterales bacterium]|nr:nucleotidyltransferase family protein [Vicinamibacterales bacterium]
MTDAQRALLAALRRSGDPLPLLRSLTPDDWSELEHLARAHRVRPLLLRRLAAPAVRHLVPPAFVERLTQQCRDIAFKNLASQAELRSIGALLAGEGIPMIVLKGAHLAPAYYGDAGLREMVDADVMVRPEHASRAWELIQLRGYRPVTAPRCEPGALEWNHMPRLVKRGALGIEVHWDVVMGRGARGTDRAGLWERSVPFAPIGESARALATEDLIIHLAVHASYHHRFEFGLRPLCDLAAVIGQPVDWPALVRRARDASWDRGVYLMLRLTHDLIGAPVPASALESLRPTGFSDALLADAAAELVDAPRTDISDRIAKVAGARGWSRLRLLLRRAFPSGERLAREPEIDVKAHGLLPSYLRLCRLLLRRHGALVWQLIGRRRRSEVNAARRRLSLRLWLATQSTGQDDIGHERLPHDPDVLTGL